jgi:hypothetical protein
MKPNFYSIAIDKLLETYPVPRNIWDCSCEQGLLSKRLIEKGYNVFSSGNSNKGYELCHEMDFLKTTYIPFDTLDDVCIITKPNAKVCGSYINHALDILPLGALVIFLMKTNMLEGDEQLQNIYRKGYLRHVFQFSDRLPGSSDAFAWFIFQKPNYRETTIDWI